MRKPATHTRYEIRRDVRSGLLHYVTKIFMKLGWQIINRQLTSKKLVVLNKICFTY